MKLTVGEQLTHDLADLELKLRQWNRESRDRAFRAFRRIGVAWKAEAIKRIPVDTGMARQHVATETLWDGPHEIVTNTGTNLVDPDTGIPYPVYLEFGTKWIAGGRVKRLGFDPFVTDSQAVHTWPAKEAEAIEQTSASYKKIDGGSARFNKKGKFVGSGAQEQMPWLRPAFNVIRDWAMREIEQAFAPPPK